MSAANCHNQAGAALPSYIETIRPMYRDHARAKIAEMHDLLRAMHEALGQEPLNCAALTALGHAYKAAHAASGAAIDGLHAVLTCDGSA